MPSVTRNELKTEIERSGKVAKFSPRAISHVVESATKKSRVSTFSLRTTNFVKHPLVHAGIVDGDGEIIDNPYVKSDGKIDAFIDNFAPGGVEARSHNKFVTVV